VIRYRAHKMGFGSGELAFASDPYEAKQSPDTSHARILGWVGERRPGRVLDLGCGDGHRASELRASGHHVVGVDVSAADGVKDRVDEFVQADLDTGLPPELDGPFDVVIAADILGHVRRPELILEELHRLLAPSGVVIASVPNFGHWYPRLRVMAGRFDYDRRGILDRTHVRFFTGRSFERLLAAQGWKVARRGHMGLPLEVIERRAAGSPDAPSQVPLRGWARRVDAMAVRAWPTLFAYQFLYQLVPGTADHGRHQPPAGDGAGGGTPVG
jgi:methionine biosynthesis protein MetW